MDQTFGLSAEILAADLCTDGGILDLEPSFSDGLKPQNIVSTLMGPEESIEDLLQNTNGGGLFSAKVVQNIIIIGKCCVVLLVGLGKSDCNVGWLLDFTCLRLI